MSLYYPCNQITNEHVFVWTGGGSSDLPDKGLRCFCGAYSFSEIQASAIHGKNCFCSICTSPKLSVVNRIYAI